MCVLYIFVYMCMYTLQKKKLCLYITYIIYIIMNYINIYMSIFSKYILYIYIYIYILYKQKLLFGIWLNAINCLKELYYIILLHLFYLTIYVFFSGFFSTFEICFYVSQRFYCNCVLLNNNWSKAWQNWKASYHLV